METEKDLEIFQEEEVQVEKKLSAIVRVPSPVIRESEQMKSFGNKIDSKTIGLVVYQDVQEEEERKKPFLTHTSILEWIKMNWADSSLMEYVIGAEKGDTRGHFHYQCVLQFNKSVQKKKGYGRAKINDVDIYYLYEKGQNWKSLVKYCQKEGDFIASEKALKESEKNKAEILLEKKTRTERIEYIVQKQPDIILRGDLTRTLDNLEKAEKYITAQPSCGFKFPEHLLEREETYLMYRWFQREVLDKKGPIRRKALVLYSKERALGKTMFAKELAGGNEEDYIICRGTFNRSQFDKPYARLLILDDMNFMAGQLEMWKALVSGERVSIREAYCNMEFSNGLPCIITTNSYRTFTFMLQSEYFKNDCYFCWVRHYLGPEGTQREDNPEAYRDFALEELKGAHTYEEEAIKEKQREKEVLHAENERKYREIKKIKN